MPSGFAPLTTPGYGLYNVTGADIRLERLSAAPFVYVHAQSRYRDPRFGRQVCSRRGLVVLSIQHVSAEPRVVHRAVLSVRLPTPDHNVSPDTSNNFDLSLEKHVKGTQLSYKITPFYRNTSNQLQFQAINPVQGILAGLNVGTQESYGVELSLQYGDFSRDGLSGLFSYTHTENRIRFSPINGVSVIDALNTQIELYNSYTSGCAGVTKSSANWQACGSGAYAGNSMPVLLNTQSGTQNQGKLKIPNPYYPASLQPLFNTAAGTRPTT